MPELEEISNTLVEIETELEKLKFSSEVISKAAITAKLANQIVQEIYKSSDELTKETLTVFQHKVDNLIIKINNDTNDVYKVSHQVIDASGLLIKKVLDSVQETSTAVIQESKQTSTEAISRAERMIKATDKLNNRTAQLIENLELVDFPTRLDKLDTTVSSINIGLLNLTGRVDSMERNLKDEVDSKFEKLNDLVEKDLMTEVKKSNRLHSAFLITLLVLVAVSLILSVVWR